MVSFSSRPKVAVISLICICTSYYIIIVIAIKDTIHTISRKAEKVASKNCENLGKKVLTNGERGDILVKLSVSGRASIGRR